MSGTDQSKKTSRLPTKIARPTSIKSADKNSVTSFAHESDTSIFVENAEFIVGDRVWVGGTKPGVIAYVGETQFGPGDWAGVVLDEPSGKNDGIIAGIRYFQCAPNRGIFSRLTRLTRHPVPSTPSLLPGIPECSRISRPSSIVSGVSAADLVTTSSGSSKTPNNTSPDDSTTNTIRSDLKISDRVIAQSSRGSKVGILKYYGNVEFGTGLWCGIELDDPIGKNDGSVGGVRYFECAPKFGLFVPAEKVSKSPVSKRTPSSCAIHVSGLSRQGTSDSLRSTSTVFTSVSGMKNLRTPTKFPNTALQATPTQKRTSPEQASEKEKYIQQLLKERELERAQMIRAATQAEEVEKKLATLQTEYDRVTMEHEIEKTNFQRTIDSLVNENSDLQLNLDEEKKKIEELVFTYEEESLTKSEIQALNEEYAEKLRRYEANNIQEQSLSNKVTINENSEKNDSIGEPPAVCATNVSDDAIKEIESKKYELKDLGEKITLKENELSYLVQKVALQENEFNDLMQKTAQQGVLNDLVEKISEKERRLDDVIQQTTQKEGELEDLIQRTNKKECQLNDLMQNITLKECELNNLKNKVTAQETIEQKLKDERSQSQSNVEDLTDQINRLNEQLSEKDSLYSHNVQALVTFLKTVCHFINERNKIVSSVAAGTEMLKNVESILRKHEIIEGPALSEAFDKRRQLEDEFSTLREQVEKIIITNITLLEKLETLTEVIKKKDMLLEEIMIERDTWRQEFKEITESKANEIKQMECRFADLNKAKINIENQLQKSEENVKKMESSILNAKETNQNEILNIRKDLELKISAHTLLSNEINNLKCELVRVNCENDRLQSEISNIKTMVKSEESDHSIRLSTPLNGSTDDSYQDAKDDTFNRISIQNKENCSNVANSSKDRVLSNVVPDIVPENTEIVQFLNSVIVDLQQKNEALLEKIHYLEEMVPVDTLCCKPKKAITPRMFCEICDMFDLHETEDCVKQSSSSPVPDKNVIKTKPLPRPYCEICEVFGHNKEDYDHEETY